MEKRLRELLPAITLKNDMEEVIDDIVIDKVVTSKKNRQWDIYI